MGRLDDAIKSYMRYELAPCLDESSSTTFRLSSLTVTSSRAIEIKPDYADAYANMASVYKDTNQPLKVPPSKIIKHASASLSATRLSQAIENYRYSIKLNTVTEPIAFCNLVHCLQVTTVPETRLGACLAVLNPAFARSL